MNKINTVFVDSDSTIYDFMTQLAKLEGFENTRDMLFHANANQISIQDYIGELTLKHRFNTLFSHGDILPDGEKLLIDLFEYKKKYDFSIVILSALYGTMDHYCDISKRKIAYDKVAWYQKTKINGISIYEQVDEIKFVNTWKDKLKFATDDSILIDDFIGTRNVYVEANKKFVHFTSHEDAIAQLDAYLTGEVA